MLTDRLASAVLATASRHSETSTRILYSQLISLDCILQLTHHWYNIPRYQTPHTAPQVNLYITHEPKQLQHINVIDLPPTHLSARALPHATIALKPSRMMEVPLQSHHVSSELVPWLHPCHHSSFACFNLVALFTTLPLLFCVAHLNPAFMYAHYPSNSQF